MGKGEGRSTSANGWKFGSASEAGYAGHNSSSSVHTSQGSSSRPVVRGGHSGHSGSSHQPASRRRCFECGDMGHFNGRGGSHSGRGGSPSGRGGGRGGSQSDGPADPFMLLYQRLRLGSSSRPVVRGGHSGHSGSSHQPASRRGCFEFGDMGHFVRDCPRTRRLGLH
ncbi:DNA-binding protein HEXBP-like [Solanum pennellii]|uniref:DNA-binding protein HEXBP-like n=1 Tax=Solanum pennellii TaxID=28526 RepID=A0ABM1GT12_SOLPN|nr:DNA-binding protein HEXBP-like [Solanum pennellii]